MRAFDSRWKETLTECLALAARLEGEGQYNNAKLLRAAVDSLSRQAAFQVETPDRPAALAERIQGAASALADLGANTDLLAALKQGANVLAAGRLPLIHETPNPYVCRTCGHVALEPPLELCPVCGAWPATFQLFPPVYWLNAYQPLPALDRLQQTPLDVASLLTGLSGEQLAARPRDGGWAIHHTVSHLRDAQGLIDYRIDLFMNEENPVLESKAVFAWAGAQDDKPQSTGEVFETYRASRAGMLAKLKDIPLAHWYRSGQHLEFGNVTLLQQVSYFAAHEMTHLPQIERLRRELLG